MGSKTIAFLMFAIGAAIGSLTILKYVKKKYERIAQEEIDSVKETFSKNKLNTNVEKYAAILNEHDYTIRPNSDVKTANKPYVIPPEEFGELDGYDTIGLSYYADQILVNENDELVEDVEGVVGFESLRHFGEYEDDSVFVRNDRLKCDYEILLDQRKYSDVSRRKLHQMEE